ITAWEAEWLKAWGQHKAGKRPVLVETDAEVDAQNAQWLKNNKKKPLDKVLADLHGARKQTIRQIENLTEDDLNRVGKFAWLRDRTLADFIAGETFTHEREHAAQIWAWRENRNRD
ncbi:MAG: ClbS/DfsB family four-helix bundle protein, partial [Chloroflexi bacterium]|nr:ClbS/DfsB family four-helix bundle protein [Chloroflexota bacterium]